MDLGWKNLDEISSTPTKQRRKRMRANSHTHPTPQEDASQRQRLEIATVRYAQLLALPNGRTVELISILIAGQ